MALSRLLPAGVPRGLTAARRRVSAALAEAPVLFIAVVLGVAFAFRVTMGFAKDAEPAPEAPTFATTTPSARPHEAPAAVPEPAAETASARQALGGSRGPKPAPTQRKKPRVHGRR